LLAAAAVVAVEAVVGVGAGAWLVIAALVEQPRGLGIAVSSGVFVVAVGLCLGFAAYGLVNVRHWSRGIVAVIQLLMLPIGYEFLDAPTTAVGAGMLVAAVATLVLLFMPASTAVFRDREHSG
jgi:hypothetical protein